LPAGRCRAPRTTDQRFEAVRPRCYTPARSRLSRANSSGVAQLAERLTVNQDVAGSSPAPGATNSAVNIAAISAKMLRCVVTQL
jgi:hypothetical protein